MRCGFLLSWFRLSVNASPISLVVVTAADRAAATCQRLTTIPVYKKGPEGAAGAIGKPPPRPQTRLPLEPLYSFPLRRADRHLFSTYCSPGSTDANEILVLSGYDFMNSFIESRLREVINSGCIYMRPLCCTGALQRSFLL